MRVYYVNGALISRLRGPADLARKAGGVLVVTGPATPDEAVWWAAQIGLFVARGGQVKRERA